MILTIDTDKETAQRLRKAADFLRSLAGDAIDPRSEASDAAAESGPIEFDEGMLNIFGGASDDTDDDAPSPARITPY